jgi:DNA-binding NarL/FixJ family response regulator
MSISIMLVEDHKIVREGTRQLLEQNADFSVIGEAADGLEAVNLVETLSPDIIIMDVRLPNMNGIDATRLITHRHPQMKVIILSAYDDDSYIFPLFEAGASGYLLKNSSGAELAAAIRSVQQGETALSPHIGSKIIHRLGNKSENARTLCSLTQRELDVLKLAALGQPNKLIATRLEISVQTVQVHLRNIFSKLDVGNRSEAVARALQSGWISLETHDN